MKGRSLGLVVCVVAAVSLFDAASAHCCTRMLWNENPGLIIVGRNMDYVTAAHPTFVVTPRGVRRFGTSDGSKRSKSIEWTVRYGNVAIYENNRFPNDGINEAGLSARTLFYMEGNPSEMRAPNTSKKELDEDHWVSYVLDNFATVAEAVDAIKNRVYVVAVIGRRGYSYAIPKHLAISDASGDSAVVEIQDGKLTIFHGRRYRIMTNDPAYQKQLANAKQFADAPQDKLPVSWSALDRFVRADYFVRHFPRARNNDAATAYGFMYSGLASVVMPAGLPVTADLKPLIGKVLARLTDPSESYGGGVSTYWQSIADLTNRRYRFKSLVAPSDVYFNLKDYNFAKGQPVRVAKRIDLHAQKKWSGNIVPHLAKIRGDIYDQAIE